ncbi:hypothetical protein M8818_006530 [Zalaria obscura]|uniref:Uncharacterized protein n=1 Tax=Zalaria obscura TaxID=2024903 RepID=A0ACC3S6M6_9PEZI
METEEKTFRKGKGTTPFAIVYAMEANGRAVVESHDNQLTALTCDTRGILGKLYRTSLDSLLQRPSCPPQLTDAGNVIRISSFSTQHLVLAIAQCKLMQGEPGMGDGRQHRWLRDSIG